MRAGERQQTVLVLSQVYLPDPASVGQHMAGAAAELARRGWRVVVLTARDGYDDPTVRYLRRERIDGVDVRRMRWCSFGKRTIAIRLLGGFSFVVQSVIRAFGLGRIDVVLVSTSPPMASLAAMAIAAVKRARITFWVMDLNPDQMVALGRMAGASLPVRAFEWLNRRILGSARDVIVLDRFMADRIEAKRDVRTKLTVLPPWPLDDHLAQVPHAVNPFRRAHDLEGKFVVMYSGNHGPTSPVSTALEAAAELVDEADLVFVFIGGGVGKREVDAVRLPNVRSLPYQPLATLGNSLSAADVHLVTLRDGLAGIVHPCKVYGAMAVARPVVLFGPEESHVGDLLRREPFGWSLRHGDVAGAVGLFRSLLRMPPQALAERGKRGRALIDRELSKATLCGRLCDLVERSDDRGLALGGAT